MPNSNNKIDALCSDGRMRRAQFTGEADTFFTRPARVKVGGKTVTGFIVSETLAGWSTAMPLDPQVFKFTANRAGKNTGLLPKRELCRFERIPIAVGDCYGPTWVLRQYPGKPDEWYVLREHLADMGFWANARARFDSYESALAAFNDMQARIDKMRGFMQDDDDEED